ncbi:inositol polyphosphate 5-phosphatase K-like [Ornithodoros turicata]|uniref:Putative skeletal muscle/kidney enriched inositol 5-phosphatase n=1 Tax=Ornithodoros turicata TaxID=34597 RepID=A0A2R5LE95_9ACAR
MSSDCKEGDSLMRDFRIYIMTWNVVCRGPIEDLHCALGLEPPIIVESLPDMYAIGFQEVSARPQHLITQAFFEEPWIQAVKDALRKYCYVKVKHVRLQGLVLAIFSKREHLIHLRGIQSTYTRTGLGGVWGNKGGVTIRLCAYGCSICYVNTHLAAHDSETLQRINEYNTIIEKQTFVDSQATNILTHDYAFWFGDLNFRVDDCTMEEMRSSIEDGTFQKMLPKDQLLRVRVRREAFHEFMEQDITFPPTYKFQIDGMGYNFSTRKPAWTDRILYRFTKDAYDNTTLDLKTHHYGSHTLHIQSDHKPVSGFFTIKVFAKPEHPMIYFMPVGPWVISQDCFAWYYTHPGTEVQSWDWIALYRDNFTSLDDHIGYVWASTRPTDVHPTVGMRLQRNRVCRDKQSRSASGRRTHSPPDCDSGLRSMSATRSRKDSDPATTSDTDAPRRKHRGSTSIASGEASSTHQAHASRRDYAFSCDARRASQELLGGSRDADTGSASPLEQKCSPEEASGTAGRKQHAVPRAEGHSHEELVNPVFYRVLFGDHSLLVSGKYRLLYLRGESDVLGMSEPFKIKGSAIQSFS